jgi:hypothetical protein
MSQLQLNKANYSKTRIVEQSLSESNLVDQQVLVKIHKFALTANNVTYAVVGEKIGYWQFFPPVEQPGDDVDEWGVLPVWGFAEIVASKHPHIPVGERLFGYFPPASHFIMTPSKLSETSWVDASPHRSHLPAGYNMYRRVEHEPGYNANTENDRMLLYPLHITAFVLYDYFQDNDWFKAEQIIIISASSKTSTGLAYGIAADNNAPTQIGLTSTHNLEMVKNLKVYDEALSYEQITQIDASKPTVIVDMSGNGVVLNTLHKHLGDNMQFCSNVGVTHWHQSNMGPDFIRDRSQMFFAPSQIQKRLKDWGPQGFDAKSREYMSMTITKSREWLKTKEIIGLEGMAEIFPALCDGKIPADEGLIVNLD